MKAKILTYGGNNNTVEHTQLRVDGVFIADSAGSPNFAELLRKIADQLNGDEKTEVVHDTWGE